MKRRIITPGIKADLIKRRQERNEYESEDYVVGSEEFGVSSARQRAVEWAKTILSRSRFGPGMIYWTGGRAYTYEEIVALADSDIQNRMLDQGVKPGREEFDDNQDVDG